MGAALRLARRTRYGWLVLALAVVGVVGLILGSEAFGNAAGPVLTVDQGFNSGQPVAPQFAPDGPGGSTGGTLFASVIQPDGKVIVVGQNAAPGPIVKFDVARYNATGTLDKSFGTNGYVQVAPTANSFNFAAAVALDPRTGDIVIAGGDIGSQDVPELVRLTPSGALDTGFGKHGSVVDSAHPGSFLTGVMVDSSRRIVTIGTDGVVRRYAANGSVDSTFGTGGHTGVLVSSPAVGSNVLALQPADGKILVAGTSSGAGTVIRLNTDGTLDSTFGSGGMATLRSGTAIRQMSLEGTSILVGGNDGGGNGLLARLTPNGTLDTSFGRGTGYDTFTPPSGNSAHVDALFYDPHPGLIVCLYYNGSSVCFSTDVNGNPTGNSVAPPGKAKDGGASFSNGVFTVLGYLGVTVYKAADTTSGNPAQLHADLVELNHKLSRAIKKLKGEEQGGALGHKHIVITEPEHWTRTLTDLENVKLSAVGQFPEVFGLPYRETFTNLSCVDEKIAVGKFLMFKLAHGGFLTTAAEVAAGRILLSLLEDAKDCKDLLEAEVP